MQSPKNAPSAKLEKLTALTNAVGVLPELTVAATSNLLETI
jgi:hypothetical protein